MVLLGERGQGKTRLIRTLAGLLDEWTPVVAGCEINDHPFAPDLPALPAARRRRAATTLPVAWRHRAERYGEKLATPDTSVGDLIGDVDPIKVAQGRTLGDPETIHYGLVPRDQPRHLRGQRAARPGRADPGGAAERAGGARHPGPRLPAAAAARPAPGRQRQPRGLHQPRPDHHAAQGPLRRRGPHPLPARARRRAGADPQEAGAGRATRAGAPARGHRPVRPGACASRPRSTSAPGVSARFAIAAAETVAAAALRRRRRSTGEEARWPGSATCRRRARRCAARSSSRSGEEGREIEVLAHLLRPARRPSSGPGWPGSDLSGFTAPFDEGASSRPASWSRRPSCSRRSAPCRGWPRCWSRLGLGDAPSARAGRGRGRVRPGGAAPDPAPGQGRAADGRTVYGELSERCWAERLGMAALPVRRLARRARPARAAVRRARGGGRDGRARSWGPQPARGAARPAAPRHPATGAAWTTCARGSAPAPGGSRGGATSTAR